MGPHGLIIGATGSGKSELLRTLVLGLALTHSPEILNFVLVDFKGGATFLGLERLNHVSAVITNLEEELPLVDRMRDALHGEIVRRQELLRAAGNYASLRDYERDRERGAKLAPLPTLFIVLDEFSELLAAKPEFIDLFVMIGRVGRSLGVHLLLASQRLEEGRLRGLDTQLSYRIGLRTYSAAESRIVLGVPDAYELPSRPGSGYLKTEATEMTRFKAAYVSGPSGGEPDFASGRLGVAVADPADGRAVQPRVRQAQGGAEASGHGGSAGGGRRRAARQARPEPVRGRDPPAGRGGPAGPSDLAAAAGSAADDRPVAAAAVHHPAARLHHRRLAVARQAACGRRDRRPALRAAPGPAVGRPVRGGGARRRGRRAAERQVHPAAHADLLARAVAHPAGDPVLLPGLRRRDPRRTDRAAARGRRGDPAAGRAGPAHGRGGPGDPGTPGAGVRRAGHRVHRGLPGHAGERGDRRRRVR